MEVKVAGTGYVGLVTGVVMAHIGHNVTCIDVDEAKVDTMKKGISPIYEQDLEKLMKENKDRLAYTTDYQAAYKNADVIFIGVGTPENKDGSANLDYVFNVCDNIIESINKDCVVVIKSTVPIGTNDKVEQYLQSKITTGVKISVVSNPEFLAQGTAVYDTLYASRIVVGSNDESAKKIMEQLYLPLTKEPYNVPYLSVQRKSAEMIKYASNDFLALKIAYINEISNLCEKVGANITEVTKGMSYDKRIGNKFLNPGIGYGGSCFPKDTKALYHLSKEVGSEMTLIKATIENNKQQKLHLLSKINDNLDQKIVAILGCAFKPGTDDLREAPSIENVKKLQTKNCTIRVYDPVALKNFQKLFGKEIEYYESIDDCIKNADIVLIMTEWDTIKNYDLTNYEKLMKTPEIYDGRNCYDLDLVKKYNVKYVSIGREEINNLPVCTK